MRSMLAATLIFMTALLAAGTSAQAQTDGAVNRGRQAEGGRPPFRSVRPCRPRPTPPTRWRRRSVWRCSRIWPGSASITARSRAKSASAWSPPSRNSRRPAAASRPACSIRRNAASSPTPRSGARKMSAGKSSPIPAPGCGSACRQNWCRSNPATPTAPNGRPPTGTIQIQLARRKEANPTTAKLAEREKKEPAGRTIDYTVVKPDFFVLSGLQGLKKFYVRGTFKGDEVRILTILYDQATENTVEPVVIAMSSAFNPFPVGRADRRAAAAQDRRIRHRRRRQRRRRHRDRPPGDR